MKPALVDDGLKSQLAALKQRETSSSLIWEPTASQPQKTPAVTLPIEADIIALFTKPIDALETHRAGNDRKERELYALLDRLSDLESHALRRRLAAARSNDELVAAFARLSIDRRTCVVAFIDDTRRRNALRR